MIRGYLRWADILCQGEVIVILLVSQINKYRWWWTSKFQLGHTSSCCADNIIKNQFNLFHQVLRMSHQIEYEKKMSVLSTHPAFASWTNVEKKQTVPHTKIRVFQHDMVSSTCTSPGAYPGFFRKELLPTRLNQSSLLIFLPQKNYIHLWITDTIGPPGCVHFYSITIFVVLLNHLWISKIPWLMG